MPSMIKPAKKKKRIPADLNNDYRALPIPTKSNCNSASHPEGGWSYYSGVLQEKYVVVEKSGDVSCLKVQVRKGGGLLIPLKPRLYLVLYCSLIYSLRVDEEHLAKVIS